jgi:hypothetical protein
MKDFGDAQHQNFALLRILGREQLIVDLRGQRQTVA